MGGLLEFVGVGFELEKQKKELQKHIMTPTQKCAITIKDHKAEQWHLIKRSGGGFGERGGAQPAQIENNCAR